MPAPAAHAAGCLCARLRHTIFRHAAALAATAALALAPALAHAASCQVGMPCPAPGPLAQPERPAPPPVRPIPRPDIRDQQQWLLHRQREDAERQREEIERQNLERQRQNADRAAAERQRQDAPRQRPATDHQASSRPPQEDGHPAIAPNQSAVPPGPGISAPPGVAARDNRIMLDYARHGLHPPRPGQVWIVNPPDFLLFDTATGQILENVPDTEGEQPSIPQSQYNVGIAWSATGAWAVRTGATVADAQAQALAACSAESQSCTIARLALSADTQACYALVRSGPVLFGAVETDIDTATNTAMASCEDSDHPNCTLQIANCNDHP